MNATEQKAFQWLKDQGAKEETIKFQRTKSPDFLTNIGDFEVKKPLGKSISFTEKQIQLLREQPNINILIFDECYSEPLVLSYFEIEDSYSICIQDDKTIKISTKTKAELFELQCAWKLHTFDETIRKLIRKAGNGGKTQ